jgi:hypothetical protein
LGECRHHRVGQAPLRGLAGSAGLIHVGPPWRRRNARAPYLSGPWLPLPCPTSCQTSSKLSDKTLDKLRSGSTGVKAFVGRPAAGRAPERRAVRCDGDTPRATSTRRSAECGALAQPGRVFRRKVWRACGPPVDP